MKLGLKEKKKFGIYSQMYVKVWGITDWCGSLHWRKKIGWWIVVE
jgi:hypothetical protein